MQDNSSKFQFMILKPTISKVVTLQSIEVNGSNSPYENDAKLFKVKSKS